MTKEQKSEIIKALAMGMSAEEISRIEDVRVNEIIKIRNTCETEIAAAAEFISFKGGGGT
jgi:hypothetical protein